MVEAAELRVVLLMQLPELLILEEVVHLLQLLEDVEQQVVVELY